MIADRINSPYLIFFSFLNCAKFEPDWTNLMFDILYMYYFEKYCSTKNIMPFQLQSDKFEKTTQQSLITQKFGTTMYYPEDLKDMYSFFTNSRFLPATTLPELSLDCLNSFQILQIIQNFLPNELRTFFKEKLKIFKLSFLARKDILKLENSMQ